MGTLPAEPRRWLVAALITWLPGSLALAAEPAAVSVRPLAELAQPAASDAPATVLGLNRATLGAELSARVTGIAVETGERVAAGQPLVELDCRDYRARAAQARAVRDGLDARSGLAEYKLERARALTRSNAVAEETLRERESEVAVLGAERAAQLAAVALAELQVERCVVHAPFAGVVRDRQAQLGALVNPGTPLLELLDVTQVEVHARVRRDLLAELRAASALAFVDGTERLPLALRAVLPDVDPRNDAVELRLTFSGPRADPGTPGRLVWQTAMRALPPDLLERRAGRLGVFVVDGERARFVPLPDAQEGRPAAIDLPPETRLVVDGRAGLADGDPLRIVD
jgi:RND family efflux transporter MFP subunit